MRSLLALLPLAAPLAADVHTVDATGAPGSDFSHPQTAVDSASDGDTLLFLGNDQDLAFPGFTIQAKSLTVIGQPVTVADVEYAPLVQGDVSVLDLGPTQRVLFQNVHVRALIQLFLLPLPLRIENCQGPVLLDGVRLDSTNAHTPVMLAVVDSDAVTLNDCEILGAPSYQQNEAGDGVNTVTSNLYVFDSLLTGGAGQDGMVDGIGVVQPYPGGHGLELAGGTAHVSNSVLTGGDGGTGVVSVFGACFDSRDGGNGLVLANDGENDAEVTTIGLTADGGLAGGFFDAMCGSGSDGSDVVMGTGSMTDYPLPARSSDVTSPVTEGGTADFSFHGEPGDLLAVTFSGASTPIPFPAFSGVLYPNPFVEILFLGVADGAGEFAFGVSIDQLSIPAATITLQGLFVPASLIDSQIVLGNPLTLVLLDSAL